MTFDDRAQNLPEFRLSEEARSRHRKMLQDLRDDEEQDPVSVIDPAPAPERRPRRRRGLIVASTAVALSVAGIGTAAALGAFSREPTDRSIAYCYATADLGGQRVQFSVAAADQGAPGDSAASALSICRKQWGTGAVRAQPPYLVRDVDLNQPTTFPVPELSPCVLEEGSVAVLPGSTSVCSQLGLTVAELRP